MQNSHSNFGELLSFYRRNSVNPEKGGGLSQEKLADLLTDKLKYPIHRNQIGGWEKGKSHIRLNAREELIALLEVLHVCGGITSIEEAEQLLKLGNYRGLDAQERAQVFWKETRPRVDAYVGFQPAPTSLETPKPSQDWADAFSLLPPGPARNFIGRADLISKLITQLLDHQIIALQGMAGTGKTLIARQLAYELRPHFGEENIFWLSLHDHNGNPRPLLMALGRACNPGFEAHAKDEVLASDVQRLLEKRAEKQELLFIIDKVRKDDWVAATKVIMQVIPVKTSVLLLVRDRDIAIYLGATLETVPQLSLQEALEMFSHYAQRNLTQAEDWVLASEIVQVIGQLPMAIMLAGKKLLMEERPGYGLANLLDEIKHQPIQALEKSMSPHEPGLGTMFAISYNDLPGDFQRLFRWLGVFDSGPIQLVSISEILGIEGKKLESQLDYLVRRSMLEWDDRPELQARRCHMHPLLRQYACGLLEHTGEFVAAQKAHLAYYLAFARRHARREKTAHDQLEATLTNLRSAIQFAILSEDDFALRDFGLALCNYSLFLSMRGYPDLALELLPKTLKACQKNKERINEARTTGNLGRAYEYIGDARKAIEQYQQALRISREMADPLEEAIWLENLWLVHRYLGEMKKAAVFAQQALEIHRTLGDYARFWAGEGRLSSDRWDYQLAIQRYEEALEAITQERASSQSQEFLARSHLQILEITCLNEIGLVYRHLGQVQKSIQYFRQALLVCQESGHLRAESDTYVDLGLAYYNLGHVQEAILCYENALKLSRRTNNRPGEANALGNLGLAYRHFGEVKKSIGLLEQALQICKEFGDRRSEANALADLGTAYRYLGQDQKAVEFHLQALKIREEVNDLRGIGASYGNLGNSYLNLGAITNAITHLEKALEISQRIGERRSEANALDNLGRAFFQRGEIDKAIPYYEEALKISREIGHRRSEANRLGRLGYAIWIRGDQKMAHPLLEQALALNQAIHNRRGEIQSLDYLARMFRQENVNLAREYLNKAIGICHEIGNIREEGVLLNDLGKTYYFSNEIHLARRYYEQALHLSRETGDKTTEGDVLLALGVVFHAINYPEEALRCFEKALALHKELGDHRGEAMLYNNLGNIFRELGQYEPAKNYYEQALSIYQTLGLKPGWSNTLANLGILYGEQTKYDLAQKHLETALKLAQEKNVLTVQIKAMGQLGWIFSRSENPHLALYYAQESLKLAQAQNDILLIGRQTCNLGIVYLHIGRREAALDSFTTALSIARNQKNLGDEEKATSYLGQMYLQFGETEQAIPYFKTALKLSQEMHNVFRETLHLKNLAELYRQMAQTLENQVNEKQQAIAHSIWAKG